MPVITITRQFGAAGVPIGRALATRLNAELLDRAIVAQAALRSGIPESEIESYDERLPGLWQRVARALAASTPEVIGPPLPEDLMRLNTHDRLAAVTRLLIEEAAARGNAIILGRGGAFILRGRPDVLHVQLHASLAARVRYLATRVEEAPPETRPDPASLAELCRSVDLARADYIRALFAADWMDSRNYDLSVDTGRLGVERSVELIAAAARERLADEPAPVATTDR
ncbi:MAG TPA: cytidylate kinase-like family protein [Candidatus Limnocylindrales bacterium]|jgi:cytidylate kinase